MRTESGKTGGFAFPKMMIPPSVEIEAPSVKSGQAVKNIVQAEKECKKCHQTKPLGEFSKNPGCKNGREGQCKVCRYAADRLRQSTKKKVPAKKRIGQKTDDGWRKTDDGGQMTEGEGANNHSPVLSSVLLTEPLIDAMVGTEAEIRSRVEKVIGKDDEPQPEEVKQRSVFHEWVEREWENGDGRRLMTEGSAGNTDWPVLSDIDDVDRYIFMDFREYPKLYAFLKETARIEFRPVVNQLMYWINDIYETSRDFESIK